MGKRVAFQQMLTRVRTAGDVDHILVYKLSRMARNRIDDALVMADLRRRGITLIFSKLAHMLRDRYYLGYLTYQGEEIAGRHEPLVDEDLFNRVQLIRESRQPLRRRIHVLLLPHKQNKTCPTPHISVAVAEDAVEQHYTVIRLNSEHLDALGDHVAAIADKGPADQSLHTTISSSHDLYHRCSDSQRRLLNQAIFRKLYIADGRITDHDLTAGLHLGPQQSDATRQMPHLSRTP